MAHQKKAKAPEPAGESAPMWIVSFADLVTLMMSFFVVLYALKQGGAAQQLETTAAIKSAFGWKPDMYSENEIDRVGRRRLGIESPPFELIAGNTSKTMQGADGSNANVETIRAGKEIVTGGKLSFDSGQNALSPIAKETLAQIALKLKGLNNVLTVKGHISVDEIPLLPDDPNGMALSYRRAMAVIDELVRLGLNRNVLRPMPCGAYEPLKTGVYDQAGLRLNRRAEVFTSDTTAGEYFPIQTVPPAASSATHSQPAHTPEN
jgi:chemotaxis protein MotB